MNGKSLREQAGLGKPIGKARRVPVIGSNETISYNEARRRIAALSDRQRNKISKFERALGRRRMSKGRSAKADCRNADLSPIAKASPIRSAKREPLGKGKGPLAL